MWWRTFFTASLAIASTAAAAAPWARISATEAGDVYWVDIGSMTEEGGVRRAWAKAEYAKPFASGVAAGAVEALALSAYNCRTRQKALLKVTYYGRRGEVIRTAQWDYPSWDHVTPGTVSESHLNFACSYPIGTDPRQIEGLQVRN